MPWSSLPFCPPLLSLVALTPWQFLMPMLATLNIGFAQFAVQLYYLQIGLIKGLTRLGTCTSEPLSAAVASIS